MPRFGHTPSHIFKEELWETDGLIATWKKIKRGEIRNKIQSLPRNELSFLESVCDRNFAQSVSCCRVQIQKFATGYYDGPMHDQDAPAECKCKNMPQAITTDQCTIRMRARRVQIKKYTTCWISVSFWKSENSGLEKSSDFKSAKFESAIKSYAHRQNLGSRATVFRKSCFFWVPPRYKHWIWVLFLGRECDTNIRSEYFFLMFSSLRKSVWGQYLIGVFYFSFSFLFVEGGDLSALSFFPFFAGTNIGSEFFFFFFLFMCWGRERWRGRVWW